MTFGVDHMKYLEYGGVHIFRVSKRCGLTVNDYNIKFEFTIENIVY